MLLRLFLILLLPTLPDGKPFSQIKRKAFWRFPSFFRSLSAMVPPICPGKYVFQILLFGIFFAIPHSTPAAAPEQLPVSIIVNGRRPGAELKPIWRFFGADEPNYAYFTNGQKLLKELGELNPGQVFFRTHNLLTSGDGTPALKWGSTGVYREGPEGQAIYDWKILDRIFDTYQQSKVRPYAQIGFMPRDLSIRPDPYQHQWTPKARYEEIYTGWAYPPRDYQKWGELVRLWVSHCLERYGRSEVEQWYWQVWNEPNIGYWRGTPEEFHKLNDFAIDAVRRALPTARVGGPDTAGSGGRFTRAFLEHCLRGTNYATGKVGTPLDFLSFHAKGAPVFTNGHVRMGIANQLRTIEEGFRIVASFPELKSKPIVIGESDPEGCAACQGPQLAYRNGTMYSSYTAASFARKHDLADQHGVNLEGALTWAFEFENQPFFAGFRSLASQGIDKPVLNVFRMFAKMRGRRLPVESSSAISLREIIQTGVRKTPDVSALATLHSNELAVMVWHYHDDDLPGPDARVDLRLERPGTMPARATFKHYRIDETNSNAYTAWKKLGSPQSVPPDQYRSLEAAGKLAEVKSLAQVESGEGTLQLRFLLPRQAVSLFYFAW